MKACYAGAQNSFTSEPGLKPNIRKCPALGPKSHMEKSLCSLTMEHTHSRWLKALHHTNQAQHTAAARGIVAAFKVQSLSCTLRICWPCCLPLRLSLHLPCTDKYQLWDNIRVNTRLTGATYDEDRALWRLTTSGGEEEEEVQVLVLAQGGATIAQSSLSWKHHSLSLFCLFCFFT